jgi:hypothetical protein
MELCDLDELLSRAGPSHWLLLGYANLNDAVVDEAVAVLAELIEQATSG